MPSTIEDTFRSAVENKTIPGAVLLATNKSGTLDYTEVFGNAGPLPTSAPLTLEHTFWAASCTKLMTTVSVLQCVEKGLFSLDSAEDLARLLPELRDPQIITGLDGDGKPEMKAASKKITMRHLLTHTSGLGYEVISPLLQAWMRSTGSTVPTLTNTDIVHDLRFPLTFEPGEKWEYGYGLDWAGKMVERAHEAEDGVTLETYMQKNIWAPLGMNHTTFHLERREDMRAILADQSLKDLETGSLGLGFIPLCDPAIDACGGMGAYMRPTDYIKVLASILRDDGKLLKSASIEEMFTPQLSEESRSAYNIYAGQSQVLRSNLEKETEKDYGLGALLIMNDIDNGVKKNSMAWAGLPNLYWWIDRKSGVCGFYASQVWPIGDLKSMELYTEFQREMYKKAAALAGE